MGQAVRGRGKVHPQGSEPRVAGLQPTEVPWRRRSRLAEGRDLTPCVAVKAPAYPNGTSRDSTLIVNLPRVQLIARASPVAHGYHLVEYLPQVLRAPRPGCADARCFWGGAACAKRARD